MCRRLGSDTSDRDRDILSRCHLRGRYCLDTYCCTSRWRVRGHWCICYSSWPKWYTSCMETHMSNMFLWSGCSLIQVDRSSSSIPCWGILRCSSDKQPYRCMSCTVPHTQHTIWTLSSHNTVLDRSPDSLHYGHTDYCWNMSDSNWCLCSYDTYSHMSYMSHCLKMWILDNSSHKIVSNSSKMFLVRTTDNLLRSYTSDMAVCIGSRCLLRHTVLKDTAYHT